MMYFVELSHFLPEDIAVVQVLRAQMQRSKGKSVHWAEWQADSSNARACPDVTLINAARLDWRQLKSVVDGCSAETVVLAGRRDSVLSLPVLPRETDLNDLLRFMPGRPSATSQKYRDSQYRSAVWVDTTPMPPMPPMPAKVLS